MRNYLYILIFLMGCNQDQYTATPIPIANNKSTLLDSISMIIDSTKHLTSGVGLYVDRVEARINKLEHDKKEAEQRSQNSQIVYIEKKQPDSGYYYRAKIKQYETEISRLNNTVAMLRGSEQMTTKPVSSSNMNLSAVSQMEKPDQNSLVVELDKRLKDDGDLPIDHVDLYIVPFSKKAKKELMRYEVNCDLEKINGYDGRQASFYQGQYFFNNIQPGKYIIKVCYYFGGYEVINRRDGYQVVKMQVSPPVQ